MDQQEHDRIKQWIKDGYLAEDMRPLKCPKCKSTQFQGVNQVLEGGHLAEYSEVCKCCDHTVGYWAHGYWQV